MNKQKVEENFNTISQFSLRLCNWYVQFPRESNHSREYRWLFPEIHNQFQAQFREPIIVDIRALGKDLYNYAFHFQYKI